MEFTENEHFDLFTLPTSKKKKKAIEVAKANENRRFQKTPTRTGL